MERVRLAFFLFVFYIRVSSPSPSLHYRVQFVQLSNSRASPPNIFLLPVPFLVSWSYLPRRDLGLLFNSPLPALHFYVICLLITFATVTQPLPLR